MPGVPDKGVLIAGFVIHSAIHAARHDVAAIFHTHHPDVVAVSALKCGLLPVSQEGCLALAVHSQARHAFEGTATDPAERVRLAENLGAAAYTLTLDNHGVICCGRSIPEALRHLWVFTKACTYQVRALAAAGGFRLGLAVLFPGGLTRKDSLRAASKDAVKLALVAALMLFVAGLLEGFARQLVTDTTLRIVIGWGIGLMWLAWFMLAGRRAR